MKRIGILAIILLISHFTSQSQGCVAIRNLAGFGQFAQLGYGQTKDKWMMDLDNRYFKANRLLMGKENITPKDPQDDINLYEYTLNLQISRILENGWSISLDMPISSNTIVSKLEHASGFRHATHAYGIGDIRFTVYKWLFDTKTSKKGNIQFGLGLKLPTGNYHSMDYFYYNPSDPTAKVLAPVNVAIQLGDGGTGFITELNAYYIFNHTVSIYGNLFYLINPMDENGVSNQLPGYPVDPIAVKTGADVNSVPDNYTLRAGANFSFDAFVFTTGLRFEGAPAHDLIGKDDGLRRVGHIFSLEPGIQYKFRRSFLYSFVTVPIERETIQTVPDKQAEQLTGKYTITPGHFADYVVFIGYAFTF
jgi:hypothetical protein